MEIKKVVVIGSGTMGSGIAAHLCNANIPVTLLDLTTEISTNARDRIYKSRPPLLIDRSKIDNIKVGNISDNFGVVKEADWIVEAVVERIDIKHQIYEKIFKARKEGAIVSSNTSSIPIKVLSEHLTESEKKDFCITHFFNPVRYMGLLEIVKNENNDLNKINDLKKFCEVELGKGAIICNDTPGFLGNRVGVYAMQIAMTEAFKMKLSVEEADAIFGRPMGIPKTGVFGLYDLIGIDLMADVLKSFIKELPKSDKFHVVAQEIPLVKKLIETGYTGRKGKGGFYRINKSEGGKVLEALNLQTGEYSTSKKIDIKSDKVDLKTLIARDDKYGEYAWSVISKIIKYASSLVPEITKEFNDIDEAMRLGFNWAKGPFEMLEEIGVKNFFDKVDDYQGNEFLENLSKTKNEDFYGERQKYTDIETLGKVKRKAISIDGNNSAQIYKFIKYFQETCKTLKYSKFPVISAPSGLTLGGGFEVLVQSNFVSSHTNIVIGLVETIVGLIPAGGGCKEMLARWLNTDEAKNDPNFAPLKVFDIIGYGKTATSPVEAVPMKYLMPEDKKIMNRNSLLEVSKEILNNNKDFKAPDELVFKLPGESVRGEMYKILDKLYNDKVILDHGMEVAKELAFVLSGGDTTIDKTITEDELFKLELDSFMKLIETKKTQEGIKHTLATGKPLIN